MTPAVLPFLLLALFFPLTPVAGRQLAEGSNSFHDVSLVHQPGSPGRQLRQSAFCPDGCEPGFCQQDSTSGALRCAKCLNNLLVSSVGDASGLCTCPPGQYGDQGDMCVDCPKGSFCRGGRYSPETPTSAAAPGKTACPTNMTTIGMRRTSIYGCVNVPGTYYIIDPATLEVSAAICGENTYCPGLKKQRGAVPCPTGFTTDGRVAQTTPSACVVPAGYYLKTPGQVAPCPAGEWKAGVGPDGNCTKCALGVTTQQVASTSQDECKVLKPGYYAVQLAPDGVTIQAAALCPWGYYCQGGTPGSTFDVSNPSALSPTEPSIMRCPSNSWTSELGATSSGACTTPPGYYTDSASGDTLPCPDGSFRADWKPPGEATSCSSCGVGVLADKTERVTNYNITSGLPIDIPVSTSASDCYIQAGQGLYYETLTKTWRAKNCNSSNYGVQNITYGLTPAPCRDCPANMVASQAAGFPRSAAFFTRNADGTGGFTSVMACVTTAGYGYNGRIAQKCDRGTYNAADNYNTCTPCPRFTTTAAPGAGKSLADCVVAPGFSAAGQCPIGTYQDSLGFNASLPAACTACPQGRTTATAGADTLADCNYCAAGWGGVNCTQKCGGTGLNATYGGVGRSVLSPDCVSCSAAGKTVTYSFHWQQANDIYTPGVVSRIGAASPIECLSEYSQIVDSAYYIPLYSDLGVTTHEDVPNFAACVDLCTNASCQLVTYDYVSRQCFVRVSTAPVYEGMPWLALKVLPSGYVGTSSASILSNSAKALSTGMYTFYQEPDAEKVGDQVDAPGRDDFVSMEDCLRACDYQGDLCSGVTVLSTVEPLDIAKTCRFVKANTNPGVFRRTMIRADLNRLIFPSSFLCPSGFTQDGDQVTPCEPLATPAVVYLFLRAEQDCSEDLVNSVRAALIAFLTNPNTAYGVYTPGVSVSVSCYDVPAGQNRRRLLAGTYADLVATITYLGTLEGGVAIVDTCSASNCTSGTAEFLGGTAQAGTTDTLPPASIDLVQVTTAPGEEYKFRTTYTLGGAPGTAFPTLTTDVDGAMSCSRAREQPGVDLFTCRPLKALDVLTLTAFGLVPAAGLDPESRVRASVTVFNTTCVRGSIPLSDGLCEVCARGSYAPAQALVCSPCNADFTTEATGSYSADQCNWCLPGRETVNCTQCDVGAYTANTEPVLASSATCLMCLNGFTTDGTGQTSCTKCLPGYYGPECLEAPKGSWSAGGFKASLNFTLCGTGLTTAGTASVSADNCTRCEAGFGQIDGVGDTCQACPKGSYSDEGPAASTSCEACGTGFTTLGDTSASQASCSRCVGGYGKVGGTGPECQVCGKGTYTDEGPASTTICLDCETGTTTPGNASAGNASCTLCSTGRGGDPCALCEIGEWSPGDTPIGQLCEACQTGYTTLSTGSATNASCYVPACGIAGAQRTMFYQDFSTDASDWRVSATTKTVNGQVIRMGESSMVQTASFTPKYRTNTGAGQVVKQPNQTVNAIETDVNRGPSTGLRPAGADPLWTNFSASAPNGFVVQIAMYLDTSAGNGLTNGQRVDWTVALNSPTGDHVQDFFFNFGFFSDAASPGTGRRFVSTASNNGGPFSWGWPKNPDRSPQVIAASDASGWYNFQHRFYVVGERVYCDLTVWSENCQTRVAIWTLGPATQGWPPVNRTAAELGGPRYGWFAGTELPSNALKVAQQIHNIVL